MGDDNVTTVEDNKPVSGSSCVNVVRLPVRVAFKLNAYDLKVLTSVTMASIHVEFWLTARTPLARFERSNLPMPESPVNNARLVVSAIPPRSSPVCVATSNAVMFDVVSELILKTPCPTRHVNVVPDVSEAGPVFPAISEIAFADNARVIVPSAGFT